MYVVGVAAQRGHPDARLQIDHLDVVVARPHVQPVLVQVQRVHLRLREALAAGRDGVSGTTAQRSAAVTGPRRAPARLSGQLLTTATDDLCLPHE